MAKMNNITIYCNEWYYNSINNIYIDDAQNKQLIWSSTNTNVAAVHPDTGSIFGVSPGCETIVARTVDGCEQDCFDVTVLKVAVADIIFCEDEIELCKGCYKTLDVRWAPGNATNKNINWCSENECVATVDSSGTVFAQNAGVTNIYAQSQDNPNVVATCRVIVLCPRGNYLTFSCTQAAVCNDGIGNSYSDQYHQSQTAYMSGILNADIHRYIVIPKSVSGFANLKGCVGVAVRSDGRYVFGVVGEVGPNRDNGVLDEFSVKMIQDLGFDTDGAYYVEPKDVVTTYIFPDTKRSSWPSDTLNCEVEAVGRNYFY